MSNASLCEGCQHAHAIETDTSVFYRCMRHEDEPERFEKYPEVPVLDCEGYEEGQPERSSRGRAEDA